MFIWNGSKAEAQSGYNDDLVMAVCIGLWVRDTALRLRQEGIALTKQTLQSFKINKEKGVYKTGAPADNPWEMAVGSETENLEWLIDNQKNKKEVN